MQRTGEIPDQVLQMKIHLSGRAINYSEWSLGLLISWAPCWYSHRTPWLLPFPCWHCYPAHQKGGIHIFSVIYTNYQAAKKPPGLSFWLWPWSSFTTDLSAGSEIPQATGSSKTKDSGRTTKSSVTICECLRLLPYSFLKSIIHSLMLMDPFLWLPSCWPAETQWQKFLMCFSSPALQPCSGTASYTVNYLSLTFLLTKPIHSLTSVILLFH